MYNVILYFNTEKVLAKNIFTHSTHTLSFHLNCKAIVYSCEFTPNFFKQYDNTTSHHTPRKLKHFPQCLFSATLSHCQCLYNANLYQQVPPLPLPPVHRKSCPLLCIHKATHPRDVYDLCVLITYQNTCWTHSLYHMHRLMK